MKDLALNLPLHKHKTAATTRLANLARVASLGCALILVSGLFVVGAKPIAVGLVPAPWDKLVHAGVFGLIATLVAVASGLRGWRMVLLAVASALLIGALDEWHQASLPGRQAGLDDLAADGIGALVAATLLHLSGFRSGKEDDRVASARAR